MTGTDDRLRTGTGDRLHRNPHCRVTRFDLALGQDGNTVTGSLQTTGSNNFGDDKKPLRKGIAKGNNVTFIVNGADYEPFYVYLQLNAPDQLTGTGEYHRREFGLQFKRQ